MGVPHRVRFDVVCVSSYSNVGQTIEVRDEHFAGQWLAAAKISDGKVWERTKRESDINL